MLAKRSDLVDIFFRLRFDEILDNWGILIYISTCEKPNPSRLVYKGRYFHSLWKYVSFSSASLAETCHISITRENTFPYRPAVMDSLYIALHQIMLLAMYNCCNMNLFTVSSTHYYYIQCGGRHYIFKSLERPGWESNPWTQKYRWQAPLTTVPPSHRLRHISCLHLS